eukprot:1161645-Pelagomonas_calceolata.AAC.10
MECGLGAKCTVNLVCAHEDSAGIGKETAIEILRALSLAPTSLHWFFTNLQLALERSIIGLRRSELWSPPPPPPSPSPSPTPTPSPFPFPAPAPSPSSEPPTSHQRVLDHANTKASRLGGLAGDATDGATDGAQMAGSGSRAYPADVRVSFKPFPWPAVTEDLGAVSAGVLFNLLLVWSSVSGISVPS